ncbi:aminopeptidase P family protein [Parapusillimonas granuli]|uniref:Aminopeptidase P family protein n=1 Tax=Parapusillimonas granuli TaxID=380911 RepID=A0A853G714_9BURK|nr:aminopeptidase P family protein [Parapusillimonas granuli]MBB5216805.1 Xaa-Pro aminopeptidase [Parapusillimonas granuli]MEB2400134.1 aminopeptidase family protein P [Alcaligenaceae bacterium]NYT51552.1 aminopeptidase P family protein [Parapusillimonas granuli]
MAGPQDIAERLRALRAALRDSGLHAYVALSSDPHLSEYLPERWQGRQWLSGFDGSAGTLVVTDGFAGLWTDSRYWEQADNALANTGIATMRAGAPDVPGPAQWLAGQLPQGARVNIDGDVLSLQAQRQWHDALSKSGIELVHDRDALDGIWASRPAPPSRPVFEHLPPHACRTRSENLAALRAAMREHGAGWHLLSSLDDIAWLFNLRGGDVSYNPVFLSYALIGHAEARLYLAPEKISASLRRALAADGIRVEPYEAIAGALAGLAEDQVLLVDPARTTVGLLRAAERAGKVEALNPTQLLKSRKNAAEIDNVRAAMEQDGAALCEFFAWFEAAQGAERITELTIDEKITAARGRRRGFVSPSFGTIAAYAANGAMPHYHATEDAHAVIEGDGLLLIDSGGQYLNGTTDITRVVPVGRVSAEQKRDYTAVLKGMIALSQAVFPEGLAAPLLDAIARAPIWRSGAEYGHGTGHGVGYFMNVHEGPQSIAYRATVTPHSAMLPGMITSNEPGLYRPGKWGIRIENLVLATPACTTEFGSFLRFETLTLCPIDTRCVDAGMLSADERDWLNRYHEHVRHRLEPLVDGPAREWLLLRTQAI